MSETLDLPSPPVYFAPRSGRYTVAPGLRTLEPDNAQSSVDDALFQIDREFPRFRDNVLKCRAERFEKYVCGNPAEFPEIAAAISRLIVERLIFEHPAFFRLESYPDGGGSLFCRLTGETLVFDDRMRLRAADRPPFGPPYAHLADALGCQVPEDWAIVRHGPAGEDRILFLHLCAPSHWAAEEKIGKDFLRTHAPVPHIEKVSAAAPGLIDTVLTRGPFQRVSWGIDFDDRLNAHPVPPPGRETVAALRARFDPEHSPVFLRVERQVLWGLPLVDAYLFTIRVYRYDARALCADPEHRTALLSALHSMSNETRLYKGIASLFPALIRALETP
ncbi:MAG: DUF3445 domain-containing protein [Capsulimonadales bacterium]|nr:DUF3445 domain-containing protein [Capsulimonadales bacterium]